METNFEKFERILGDEYGYGDAIDESNKTAETLQNWIDARGGYNERGYMHDIEEHEGVKFLHIEKTQGRKGDVRKNIVIADFGDYRLVYLG